MPLHMQIHLQYTHKYLALVRLHIHFSIVLMFEQSVMMQSGVGPIGLSPSQSGSIPIQTSTFDSVRTGIQLSLLQCYRNKW